MTTTSDAPNPTHALGDDAECLQRVLPLFTAADVHANFPASTATVAEVLRSGGGFDVSPELLEGWCRSGMVPDVALRSGRFAWSPRNVLTAAVQADTWRRWIPLDPRHIHKMTAVELAEAQAVAAGSTAFTDLDTFDVNAFVEILSRCNDHAMRQTFATAFKTKLRALGVLDK
jgi:hypothetical protein